MRLTLALALLPLCTALIGVSKPSSPTVSSGKSQTGLDELLASVDVYDAAVGRRQLTSAFAAAVFAGATSSLATTKFSESRYAEAESRLKMLQRAQDEAVKAEARLKVVEEQVAPPRPCFNAYCGCRT